MFITLLVLGCFNLLEQGFDITLPRIVDTLIGFGIAWLAVAFIWPDWRFRNVSSVIKRACHANCRYLDAILKQYHQGKDNGLDYRVARRDAHNADAELASVVSSLSAEKNTNETLKEHAFRLLCLNHSLLGYISALGAHREKITSQPLLQLMDTAVSYIDDILLSNQDDGTDALQLANLSQRIEAMQTTKKAKDPLVLQQIGLMISLLLEIAQLKKQIMSKQVRGSLHSV
ncbi:hypothetical protein ETR_02014 [Erwinia tracheiphila PSU-1]|nr:hypothetical protein ETR_02014 [Erwinia tracheiphila PSU-1]